MKTWVGMLALLVALTSCGSSSASSSASSAGASGTALASSSQTSTATSGGSGACGPANATTLASDSVARVYSLGQAVYGCTARGGRPLRLGAAARSIREGRAGPVALAGTVAAYGLTRFGIDTVSSQVIVRRLTDGATLTDLPVVRVVGAESFESVQSIVVKSDGSVAWIGSVSSIVAHRERFEVHSARGSSDSMLDSGPNIAPTSLRLDGSALTWRHATATRRATLH